MAKKIVSWAVAMAMLPAMGMVAQQSAAPGMTTSRTVRLNVEAETKSGEPVSGLTQQNFRVMDNGAPQNVTSFKEVSVGQEQVEVIVLIDAVNANFDTAAYARDQVQRFLHSNGGKMSQPTTIAVLTDKGVQAAKSFSTDGNALSAE